MPGITDLFLIENPSSNSQVTKRIQSNNLSTRALVQYSIVNEVSFGKEAQLQQNVLVHRSLPTSY